MKPSPAAHDNFQPGAFGRWALGLAGATRSRFREEFAEDAPGDEDAAGGEDTRPVANAGDLAAHRCDS